MSGDSSNWTWAETFTAVGITIAICVTIILVAWMYFKNERSRH